MPAARTRRPTPRQAELLDRLLDLFLAEGFSQFTVEDLAARLHCSKSTLYALAASKDRLAAEVVRYFFRRAAARVEARIARTTSAGERLAGYLAGVSEELRPASRQFLDDVAAFDATREAYARNSRAAADRVRAFIHEGMTAGEFRDVPEAFVAEMVGATIAAIQRGEVGERTGLSDAAAFEALAAFLLGGLARHDVAAVPAVASA